MFQTLFIMISCKYSIWLVFKNEQDAVTYSDKIVTKTSGMLSDTIKLDHFNYGMIIVIKESNLIFEDEKIYVEVMVGEQVFEKREIKTGISDGINIEVVSGLTQAESVKKI